MKLLGLFAGLMWCNEFSTIAETYLMKNLEFSISNIAIIITLINLPWFFRVPIGFISDKIGNREIQIFSLFLYCSALWAILGFNPQLPPPVVCVFMGFQELGAASILTIVDSLLVVATRADENVPVRSFQFRTVGKMASEFVSAYLLQYSNDIYLIFRLEALWNLLMAIYVGLFFVWGRQQYAILPTQDIKGETLSYFANLRVTLTKSTPIRDLILFLMFMYSIPDASGANMYYYIGPLGYTPMDMGNMAVISNMYSLIGAEFKIKNIRRLSMFYASMGNLINIPTLLIITRVSMHFVDDTIVSYLSTAVMSIMTSIVSVSFITAASMASGEGNEGSAFSTYVTLPTVGAIFNIAGTYALIQNLEVNHHNFENLVLLNVICASIFLTTLIPPFFIRN